jgi:uncharacterized protein (TIGR02453 family)
MSNPPFTGFPIKTLQFFTDLANNNNKTWFDTHKPDYESYVLGPARDFVIALGERLRELSPNVVADPRVNKSIFKVFRDVRFSMNKTPYKTNLALWFPVCEGGAKFDKPGYYFQLGRNSLMLGVGIHHFSKELLKGYRDSVVDPVLGPQLAGSLALLIEKGYGVGEKTYKRIPRDCESNLSKRRITALQWSDFRCRDRYPSRISYT